MRSALDSGGEFLVQSQSDDDALLVREISDDLPHRLGELQDEGRHRHDLIRAREPRILREVDHLDRVLPSQMAIANGFQILERGDRPWGLPRHVELEYPSLGRIVGLLLGSTVLGSHGAPFPSGSSEGAAWPR